jgi:hypothetical protein
MGNGFHYVKTYIMTGSGIFTSHIAQSDQQEFRHGGDVSGYNSYLLTYR